MREQFLFLNFFLLDIRWFGGLICEKWDKTAKIEHILEFTIESFLYNLVVILAYKNFIFMLHNQSLKSDLALLIFYPVSLILKIKQLLQLAYFFESWIENFFTKINCPPIYAISLETHCDVF
jgi:hypothetical protein